jgi:2-hydroxychromene-2-carboxylate isomerase
MPTLDVWFDYSSPFAYLGVSQAEALARRQNAELRWRPILLGGLFRDLGQVDVPLFAMGADKQAYVLKDLERWAWWWGLPFRYSPHFPLRTVLPLRVTLAHPQPGDFIRRVFRAAWAEEQDISRPEVLLDCGATPELLEQAAGQKESLRQNNEAAKAAGIFGVPTFVVNDRHLFWGQDRISLVEATLAGMRPPG